MYVDWDPEKARSNLSKHGVRFADAELVFSDPFMLSVQDNDSIGEQRFVGIGRDATDKILVVVYTIYAERIRLISARKATKREVYSYEEGI